MNVLSLFDGISCGQIVLNQLHISYDKYFSSEIKSYAIQLTQHHYPNTIQLGDVCNIQGKDLPHIDLLIGGSPCQNHSSAMKKSLRLGLEGSQSSLFYEYYRLYKEIQPKYFLLENVGSMKQYDQDIISELLHTQPIRINSSCVSPALRNRIYWTNIYVTDSLQSNDIQLQDILTCGWTDRKKARCLLVSDSRPLTTPIKMFHRYYSTGFTTLIFKNHRHYLKCKEHYDMHYKGLSAKEIDHNACDNSIYNGVRYMTQRELERCQTIPEGYTDMLTRNQAADVLGDGWTIDVIKYIIKPLRDIL